MRNQKGQGALEYLLLIGGAVLVAAIVIVLLLGINQSSGATTNTTVGAALCTQKIQSANPTGTSTTCAGSTICVNKATYNCAGNLPNCTASITNPVVAC